MPTTTESPVYIAINKSRVVNSPESLQIMQEVGPRVCILTASSPGFLGFQANYQTGILPLAGRYGGAKLHMERELNPIRNYQYTVWRTAEDHGRFHEENFAKVFELCVACLPMVVEGPWEPVYSVVGGRLPPIRSMGQIADLAEDAAAQRGRVRFATPDRVVALAEHSVKPGEEAAFEQGAIATMEALSGATGFLGYVVLKNIGVNPWGSFMLDPASTVAMLETLGANPPRNPKANFEMRQAAPTPAEYLIHSEWESAELAQLGLGRTLVNRDVRRIHNEGVLAHLIRGPYVVLFSVMMEEPSWRAEIG